MIQNEAAALDRHNVFVKNVTETGVVYALKNEDGYATSSSNELEGDDGEPVEMICFWSDKALAESCIEEEWADYEVEALTIADFLENWCIGMSNEGVIAGTNFNSKMLGYEIEPLDLILEIIEAYIGLNKELPLKKFDDINDLEKQVRRIVE
mgnify:FL=1